MRRAVLAADPGDLVVLHTWCAIQEVSLAVTRGGTLCVVSGGVGRPTGDSLLSAFSEGAELVGASQVPTDEEAERIILSAYWVGFVPTDVAKFAGVSPRVVSILREEVLVGFLEDVKSIWFGMVDARVYHPKPKVRSRGAARP